MQVSSHYAFELSWAKSHLLHMHKSLQLMHKPRSAAAVLLVGWNQITQVKHVV